MNLPELHTNIYDFGLQRKLQHFKSYPQLLPFIGKNWEFQLDRILFIGESHYLPVDSIAENNSKSWYENSDLLLSEYDKRNINTRNVINSADYYWLDKTQFSKGHTIFYHLRSAIFKSQKISNKNQNIFNRFGFYNYFQRPAEVAGKSIKNTHDDDTLAYLTLRALSVETKPTLIVFISKKAFQSFTKLNVREKDSVFKSTSIYSVPHPSCTWWNRGIKAYGGKTGSERFIEILSQLNLNIAD